MYGLCFIINWEDEGCFEMAKKHGPGKELMFVFDNCAGQNRIKWLLDSYNI